MPVVNHQRNSRHLFAIMFSILIPSSVFALPSTWQGPYVGIYSGGGFGNSQFSTNVDTVTDTSYFSTSADINAVNNAGTSTENPNTWIIGIQAGHDWVYKQLVYGVALDYSMLSLSSSSSVNNISYPDNSYQYSLYTSMSTNWLFTLRGRIGYPAMLHWPSLFYVTGGMAMTQLKVNNSFSDNSPYVGSGGNDTAENQIGWTAGAGVELSLLDRMSINFEYAYVGIPSVEATSSITNTQGGFGIPAQSLTSPFSTTGDFHANLIKIGLIYRFDE